MESNLNNRDIKIDSMGVEGTLFLPLLARARETEKKNPIVRDIYARDIVAKIDHDFSEYEKLLRDETYELSFPIRAYNFDNTIREFMAHNRKAVVVNIGAGLDTTFQRTDNGSVCWINIELPDVAALRQQLIPDSDRERTIAKSAFDFTWIDDISQQTNDRAIMFIAAGVFFYFEAHEVEILFHKLAETYPASHLVFDSVSWFMTQSWNRKIRKDKVLSSALWKWHLRRAFRLKRWVDTIKVVEEYPMFAKVRYRYDWGKKAIWKMKITNFFRLHNVVHVQL